MLSIQKNLKNSFFALLSLPSTGMGFALCVQISALSWILNTKYGFDVHEVGIVWAAGPLAGIIGQVLIGILSDQVWFWGGRRRPFILVGGFIAAMMILALPYIDVIDKALGLDSILGVAIAVALLLDLAINISFNPTRSIISDVTPQGESRTKGYTWMQTISGMFGVLAYVVGASMGNYTLIYIGAFIVLIFSVIPIFFIEEPKDLIGEEAQVAESTKTDVMGLVMICAAHAFTWLGVQTMFVYIFAYIKEVVMGFEATASLDASLNDQIGTSIGYAFAVLNTVGFILPAFVLEPLAAKIGKVRTHTICMGVMALGYGMILLFGKSMLLLYILMAVVGVGWAAAVSLPFAIMSEKVNQAKIGLYMGIFNLSVVLPQLIVSSVFGKLIQEASSRDMVFTISTISLAVSTVLWFFVKENKKSSSSARFVGGGGH